MNKTHVTLLQKLKEGDERSWIEFRNIYRPLIFYCARKSGLPPEDFFALEQEVLLRFMKVSRTFEYDPQKGKFRTYLGKIVRVAICDIMKRGKVQNNNVEFCEDYFAPEYDFERRWELDWRRHLFWRAMKITSKKFPAYVIRAFQMNVLKEIPAGQVAVELKISVASVYNYRNRVLVEVKKTIGEIED